MLVGTRALISIDATPISCLADHVITSCRHQFQYLPQGAPLSTMGVIMLNHGGSQYWPIAWARGMRIEVLGGGSGAVHGNDNNE